jgi:hypothetical protein
MAVLDDQTRQSLRNYVMRRWGVAITKDDLRAGIDATDSWIDTNSNSYNTALPLAARNGLSAQEKTVLFCIVALRRAGFGEVI